MAEQHWVVNASPLIALAKIEQLELLLAPSRILRIPEAVAQEIGAGPPDDSARVALANGFGGVPVPIELASDVGAWGLGSGESAVLCLAAQTGAMAILDDRDARRAAKTMGLDVLGTLGVILRARAEGRIASASPLLKELQRHGLRLDNGLVAKALQDGNRDCSFPEQENSSWGRCWRSGSRRLRGRVLLLGAARVSAVRGNVSAA